MDAAWEEAWDEDSQTPYYFHRDTGETSWTLPSAVEQPPAVEGGSPWRQAFDEASQTAYYYHVLTGETSWTRPVEEGGDGDEDARDASVLAFAAVALQARLRGRRGRKTARRLLRARYEVSTDPETGGRVFTDVRTRESSALRPLLFARLGVPEGHEAAASDADGGDSDSEDFDALQDEDEDESAGFGPGEGDAGAQATAKKVDEEEEEGEKKKRRRLPRSKAQELVDAAEDDADATTLDLSGLDAVKLSSRIWNLERLRVLVLARNKLARLPSGVQDLTQLQELDVGRNLLSRLPSCLQTTETLRVLRAPSNRIASFSPRLWKLRGLRELDLSANALQELPFVEGDLALLRETREWQVGVGLLRALEVLQLSHNQLAAAPVSIGQCQALVELDLSHNALSGALSDEVASLKALRQLRLAHNALSALPARLGELERLETLDVAHNALQTLPDGMGALRRLRTLDLSHNELRALPEALGALEALETLVMDGNARFAALGAFFRRLARLQRASVAACAVARIESPDALRDAPIRELVLANNALAAFALRLGEHSLETLDLRGNELERAPTAVLEHCRRLRTLDLSHNRLTSLPPSVGRLATLETLRISGNALERLPDALTQCAALRELQCDHNELVALPTRMGMLQRLERLHVAFNRLTALPSSLRDLGALQCVYANDNALAVSPPSLLLLSRHSPCFVELSNNPFTRAKPVEVAWKEAFAQAVALVDAQQFAQGERQLSELLRSSRSTRSSVQWGELRRWRPQWRLQRALSRVLQLPEARRAVDGASEHVAQLETKLTALELLADRQRLLRVKKAMATSNNQVERQESRQDASKEALDELEARPEVDDGNYDEPDCRQLEAARQQQAAAVRKLETLARGALTDLRQAIAGKVLEVPTALYLQGIAYAAHGEHFAASRGFTAALDAMNAPPTSNAVTRQSVHVLTRRAEAFSRLGQLPRALLDLRRVLLEFPTADLGEQRHEMLEEMESELARRWEAQRIEYFVDDHEASRAFDVEPTTGLLRRPEVTDIVHDSDVDATPKKPPKDTTPVPIQLAPAQRFARDVAAGSQALAEADAKVRAAFDAVRAANVAQLTRARDFKREVRETLRLEMEEARQRAVESELARLAAERAAERDREFHERLWMKFEDESAAWLAAEAARVEAERLRRLEKAQRKQEAQAAYEKRLARRGGRRQAKARRT